MRSCILIRYYALVILLIGTSLAKDGENQKIIPQLDREKLPGRQVKVAG